MIGAVRCFIRVFTSALTFSMNVSVGFSSKTSLSTCRLLLYLCSDYKQAEYSLSCEFCIQSMFDYIHHKYTEREPCLYKPISNADVPQLNFKLALEKSTGYLKLDVNHEATRPICKPLQM